MKIISGFPLVVLLLLAFCWQPASAFSWLLSWCLPWNLCDTFPFLRLFTVLCGGCDSPCERSCTIANYINSIRAATYAATPLTYPNNNATAPEQSLNWLILNDTATDSTDELKLRQRFALAVLWYQNGPFSEGHIGTWLSSGDECNWASIESCVDEKVTDIDLGGDGLKGQLSSDLALLTALEDLKLNSNELEGNIPTEIGLLSELTRLDLNSNGLRGSIPTEIGALKAMTVLGMSGNNIPTDLTSLDLHSNELTGNIPPELGSLVRLRFLFLYTNKLTGVIPPQLTNLSALRVFQVHNNMVTSNAMPFCDGTLKPNGFSELAADCGGATPEVICLCCDRCCPGASILGC